MSVKFIVRSVQKLLDHRILNKCKTLILAIVLCIPFTISGLAFAAPSTVNFSLTVADLNAGKANATALETTGGTSLGSCQNLSSTALYKTCTISVPVNTGILAVAQPAPGESWKLSVGGGCLNATGPVCHIQVGTSNVSLLEGFGTATSRASISALTYKPGTSGLPIALGQSPTLSPYNFDKYPLTVNGSGFPANSPATLSDNGKLVATGSSDPNGVVSFTYQPQSESQLYRKLVVGVAGQTATTDVYNSLIYYEVQSTPTAGTATFTITETDMDSTVDNYFQFNNNAPVPVSFTNGNASQGYAQIVTPNYVCQPGTNNTFTLYGTRGDGTTGKFTYSIPFTGVSC